MTFDLDELREAEQLLGKIAAHAEKILPVLQLLKETGGAVLPKPVDRLIQRGDIIKMLKTSDLTIGQMIKAKRLTPLYVAGSSVQKFWLSEVEKLVSTEPTKTKPNNLPKR